MDSTLKTDNAALSMLRRSSLLASLSDGDFQNIVGKSEQINCAFGDVIDTQQKGNFYILVSGKIRLIEKTRTNDESPIVTLEHSGEFWSDAWATSSTESALIARASEPSVLLRLSDDARSYLSSCNTETAKFLRQNEEQFAWLSKLHTTGLWQNLTPRQLRVLLSYCQRVELKAGDSSLQSLMGLCILYKGSIELTDDHGKHNLSVGEYFVHGKVGPIEASKGSLQTLQPSELIVLSEHAFSELSLHAEDLAQRLIQITTHGSSIVHAKPKLTTSIDGQGHQSAATHEAEAEPLWTQMRRYLHQYPFIMQQSQMDCGITCIAMVALMFGKRLDINDLRERAGVSIEGTSMLSLAETAENTGFMTRGIRGTYEGLLNAKLPLICFWKNNHFVVLYEINQKEALIGDPGEGLVKVSREEFTKNFSKSALEMVPTANLKMAPNAKNPLKIILPLLKPYSSQARDILLAGVVFQCLMMITPFFTQTIVDRVMVHEDISMLNMLLIGMILVTCFQSAITFTQGVLISTLSTKLDHELFVQFFKHLFSLPLSFFEQRSTGDVLARFNENSKITAFLSGNSVTVLLDGAMTSIYLAVLFWYSWKFGAATVFYAAMLIVATVAYTPMLRGFSNELFKKSVLNDSCLIESVHGVEKIKASAAENRTRWKWELIFVDKLAVSFRQQLAFNGYHVFTQMIHLCGRILLMWLGAHLVIGKEFTVGQYMAANMMAGMVIDPLMRLTAMWQSLQSVNIAVERLGDVFRSTPEQTGLRARLPQVKGEIEFRNVSFRYNANSAKNTLLNINFKMRPNEMVAIVGRSGSGKTTIARMIQALYLPSAGQVLIDGIETNQLELSDLRKFIGVVAQVEFFFSGTVRENISFYRPDAPIDEVISAARIAGIHEKILSMGSGYETMLVEGGQNFSGGERQRLAIARALLHNPRIMIFDEATSALDSESESQIQKCMDSVRHGRTMVVIAHRLSTIKSADIILVVDQGQIVERGTHDELLQKKGLYFSLCSHQSI